MSSRIIPFPARASAPAATGAAARILGFGRRIAAGLAAADRLYRERRYLEEMDDRMLEDIGIGRGDVEAELQRKIRWADVIFRP